jgi:hypothetical protein
MKSFLLQLICNCIWSATPSAGREAGGMRVPETRPWVKSVSRSQTVSRDHLPNLPATFNRLAWSNLAAQSAEQIAPAAAPIVAVLLLGVAIASLLHNCEPPGPRKGAARLPGPAKLSSIWKSGPDCFVALLLAMTAERP